MTWLELTIIYLAIGCAVGMWLTFKDLQPIERIPSKVIKRILFWPAYFLSLSKRKPKPSKRLNFVFDGDRFPDAREKAETLLSLFPKNAPQTSYFEFKDDLERYIGLRYNLSDSGGDYSEFWQIAGVEPTEGQKAVIIRNQKERVREHLNRSRHSLLRSIDEAEVGNEFTSAALVLFETIQDAEAIEELTNVRKPLDAEGERKKEVLQWIQEEKLLP